MSQLELPHVWNMIRFGDLNQYKSSIIQPERYEDKIFELYSVPVFFHGKPEILSGKDIGSSKQYVKPNDVLVCKINPRINRVWIVGEKGKYDQIASSEWIVMRSNLVNSRYLLRYFQSEQFRTSLCADVTGVGGSLTRAQPKKVATFQIPLAPLAEQQVIVDKLDILLAQIESIKARLERISAIIKYFRQSVLAAAVSGKLTEEWRFKNNIASGKIKKLELLGNLLAGQSPSKSEVNTNGEGIPYVTGPEQWDGKKISIHKWTKYPKRIAPEGSIFITVKGAGVGKTFLGCYAAIGRDIYAFVPNNDVNFLYALFAIQNSTESVILKAKGLIPGLTKNDILEHEVYLPHILEQNEIVSKVNTLQEYANSIEETTQLIQKRVKLLTQSIFAKAFKGELTAGWREQNQDLITGVNNVEALLDRIQTEVMKEVEKPKKTIIRKRKVIKDIVEPIPVIQALINSGKPLNSYDLFIAANYPANSETELVEQFYVDLRNSIDNGKILEKSSEDGQSFFELNN